MIIRLIPIAPQWQAPQTHPASGKPLNGARERITSKPYDGFPIVPRMPPILNWTLTRPVRIPTIGPRMAPERTSTCPVSASSGAPSARPRWYRNLWLPLLTIILLTLAFPPIGQFYLAWIALVPWLICVTRTRSPWAAFLISMFMGWILYIVNMYWLWKVTIPGWLALTWYMSLYWGIAAVIVRGLFRRFPPNRFDRCLGLTAAIPTLFVALEYIRSNLWTGIPYLNLSHTQTPLLVMCQIADLFGAYGVTFLLVAVNTFLALALLSRRRSVDVPPMPRTRDGHATALIPACILVLALLTASFFYGLHRMAQPVHRPGPVITVVQANFPQSNTGDKGATEQQIVDFHIDETTRALQAALSKGIRPDLVVWSETMMPPINPQACALSPVLQRFHDRIGTLARDYDVSILTGGIYWAKFRQIKDDIVATDRRNSAYFFTPLGQLSHLRYDKIHLVPFGEFIPFKNSIPLLYDFFMKLSPYDYDYTLSPGNPNDLTVFSLSEHQNARPTRFVVPVCFEDLDSALVGACSAARTTPSAPTCSSPSPTTAGSPHPSSRSIWPSPSSAASKTASLPPAP